MSDEQGNWTRTGDAVVVREVFEEMPLGQAATEGPEHRFIAMNAAYGELVGRFDLVGQTLREAFPEVVGQQIFEMFDGVYVSGQTQVGREWRVQLGRGPDGAPREVFSDFTVTARRSTSGETIGLLIYTADVTERVRQRQAAEAETAAVERRYQAARDVVADLQEALLPAALPVLPAVSTAARYLVAAEDQSAGGDWFDALPLADGRLALVVGDIVGHGVAASAAMGQLRAVLGELLTETGSLEQSLEWVDRMASRSLTMRAATVCVAVLEPTTGELEYSTCGHPPPLLVGPDGTARFLVSSGAGPLGTGSPRRIAQDTVEVGEVLALFSDGLIERPGQTLSSGMDRLARVAGDAVADRIMPDVAAAASAVERVCQHSVELLTREGYDDDVTILAAQRREAAVAPLRMELPAEPTAFAASRTGVLDWLGQTGVDPRDEEVLELAVTELVANGIEHAYPPHQPGILRLSAALGADGVVQLEVADDGAWREPAAIPPVTRGRGLWLTEAAVDELDVDHPEGQPGTVVTVRRRLRHPATLASGPAHRIPQIRSEYSASLEEGPPRTLRVTGPLDGGTAALFADRLAIVGRGGTYPVWIDLTAVDVLSSAGVSVLLAARDDHTTHHQQLCLIATPGSVPAQVLDLVGLDFAPGRRPAP